MVSDLLIILAAISGLFVILLLAKAVLKKSFCVICGSVCGTWIGGYILWRLGLWNNPILLALLMGQSITGIYYLWERKVRERYHVFRLPFLLSLTALFAFLILPLNKQMFWVGGFLTLLWVAFFAGYFLREKPRFRSVVRKLIECCKNW